MHICVSVYIHVCMCTHTCIYVCVYICVYIFIYQHLFLDTIYLRDPWLVTG